MQNQRMHQLIGTGKDENKQLVEVTVDLKPHKTSFWSGYYEDENNNNILNLKSL